MKTATIVTLGLIFTLFGVYQLHSTEINHAMNKVDGMIVSQSMNHDSPGAASSGASAKGDTTPLKSDNMKKQDVETMQHDAMKGMPTMIPTDAELRQRLTPLQYKVTRENGTEPPFKNAYWDNHEPGIYVDIISGVPLFSSIDKYDSRTGWPSFTRPLDPSAIVEKEDRSFFSVRTEVRGKLSDAHLGHVFDDGPPPTGLRYCMNSAALRFIPKNDLAKEGYGEYEKLFK